MFKVHLHVETKELSCEKKSDKKYKKIHSENRKKHVTWLHLLCQFMSHSHMKLKLHPIQSINTAIPLHHKYSWKELGLSGDQTSKKCLAKHSSQTRHMRLKKGKVWSCNTSGMPDLWYDFALSIRARDHETSETIPSPFFRSSVLASPVPFSYPKK